MFHCLSTRKHNSATQAHAKLYRILSDAAALALGDIAGTAFAACMMEAEQRSADGHTHHEELRLTQQLHLSFSSPSVIGLAWHVHIGTPSKWRTDACHTLSSLKPSVKGF